MKRAIEHYTVMVLLGVLCCYMFFIEKYLGIIFAVVLVFTMYKVMETKDFILIIIFFAIGFILFYSYFSLKVEKNGIYTVTIEENKGFYYDGSYKGRKVKILLKGEDQTAIGDIIDLKGSFEEEVIYERGYIGKIYGKEILYKRNSIFKRIYEFRKYIIEDISKEIGKEKGALVNGAAYGVADDINKESMNEFKTLGIIHVISVSGFHLALVFSILEKIMGYKIALVISFLYVIFTGGKSSTLRAFIMIFFMKISKKIYKRYSPLGSLSTSALILMVYKPYFALDIGFHLSYLATLGIILFYNKLRRKLYKLPKYLNENLSICLSAQVLTFPYMILIFNNFSLGFLIGNIVLIPLYSLVVIFAMIYLPLNFIEPVKKILLYAMAGTVEVIYKMAGLLMKITPPIIYMSYETGIVFCIFFMAMVFYYKRGKYIGKKLLLISCISYILISYSIFPTVVLVREGYEKAYLIKDGFNRELIVLREGKEKRLRDKFIGFKFIDGKHENIKVKLGRKYGILINKDKHYIVTKKDNELVEQDNENYIYTIINEEIVRIEGLK